MDAFNDIKFEVEPLDARDNDLLLQNKEVVGVMMKDLKNQIVKGCDSLRFCTSWEDYCDRKWTVNALYKMYNAYANLIAEERN